MLKPKIWCWIYQVSIEPEFKVQMRTRAHSSGSYISNDLTLRYFRTITRIKCTHMRIQGCYPVTMIYYYMVTIGGVI